MLQLKSPWLALLALACQTAAIAMIDPADADLPRRLLMVGGSVLALAFVWRNRAYRPLQVLAVGLSLNLAVMLTNGGLMPVTPERAVAAGLSERTADLRLGDPIPRSKDILKEGSETNLAPLSDILVFPRWMPVRGVASPGDMLIAFALLTAVFMTVFAVLKRWISQGAPHRQPSAAGHAPRNL